MPFPPTQCKLMTTATTCTPIPRSTTSRPRSEHSPVKSRSIRTEELAPLCTCTVGMASGGFCAGQPSFTRFRNRCMIPAHERRDDTELALPPAPAPAPNAILPHRLGRLRMSARLAE